jgi:hypothetical protein
MPNLKRLLHGVMLPRADAFSPHDRFEPMPYPFTLFGAPRRVDPQRLKFELELMRYLP